LREQDNFRAALDHALAGGGETGPRLACALGGLWLARDLFQEGQAWLERALAVRPADQRLRADLLRLLGAVLYAAGDMGRAQAVLAEGLQAAADAGAPTVQARIRVLLTDIHAGQEGRYAEALESCQAAAALLESENDLEGLADTWLLTGKVRFWGAGDPLGANEALERAGAYARRSANHYAELESSKWRLANLMDLLPIDVAVGHGERLLEAVSGDPWAEAAILHPLSLLYGYAGRFADARAAGTRAEAIFIRSGAKFEWAAHAIQFAGRIEMIAGNYAVAERNLRQGYDELCAMGDRGTRATTVTLLAEAAYAQGRLGETQRLTEEAEALAGAEDFDAQARWRATRAKLLARRGQHPAAARLAEEAVALIPATGGAPELAEFLVAQAEVSQLAGALDKAEASLRRALQFYQDRRIVPLAERTRAALASLADQHAPR